MMELFKAKRRRNSPENIVPLPLHLRSYVDELALYLLKGGSQSAYLLSDRQQFDFLKAALPLDVQDKIEFVEPDRAEDFDPGERLLIVTDASHWTAHRLHGRCVRAKAAGRTIVLLSPERRLPCRPSGWTTAGIMVDGLFHLMSTYLRSVRRGSYVEFGVFDGHTFATAFHALRECCDTFYAFDSFTGIVGAQEEEVAHFADGEYSCNEESFTFNLCVAGVDLSRVCIVPGAFQETIKSRTAQEAGITKISAAHIDVDIYEPARLALDFITPSLRQGSLLLFDDYDQLAASNQKGERRAVKEWLAANSGIEIEPYRSYAVFGRSFVVHLPA